MRAWVAVACVVCASPAAAAGWEDTTPCATTPQGCAPDSPVVEEPPHIEGRSPFVERRLLVNIHLGIATPYGAAGASVDLSLAEWLALEAGAGASTGGAQAAVMPRIRVALGRERRNAIGFAMGASVGRHVSGAGGDGLLAPMSAMGHSPPDTKIWEPAWWHNTEVSWEKRPRAEGVALRTYMGVARVLNPDDYRCEEYLGYGCEAEQGNVVLYGGIALGLGF